jgi:hypothetical protein
MSGEHRLPMPRRSARVAFAYPSLVLMLALSGCGTGGSNHSAASSAGTAGAAAASQPLLGYTWDAAHAGFRAMLGVPGAASLSNSVVSEGTFSPAVLCLRKSYALLTNPSGAIYVVPLPDGVPLQITSQLAANQRIVVSPSCSNALVYAAGASQGILISGLPSTPELQSLNFAGSASIAGAAVGDLGDILLANLQPDGSTSIQLLAAAGGTSSLGALQHYGAMGFVSGGATALLADSGANKILMAATTSHSVVLASSSDGVSLPFAIASSADGRQAVIANRNGTSLLHVTLAGNPAPAKVPCSCQPSELIPLAGNAAFQVSDLSAGTIYVLDGSPAIPRTVFIPASNNVSSAGPPP